MARPHTHHVADALKECMQRKGYTAFNGSTNWASDTVEYLFQTATHPDKVYIVNITRTDQEGLKNILKLLEERRRFTL